MARQLSAADVRLRRSESVAAYLPVILSYPFRRGARITLLFTALFTWLFSSHVLALPGLIITLSATLQFLMLVVQHTASGKGDAPALGSFRSFSFSLATFGLVMIVSAGVALQFAVADSVVLSIIVATLNCLVLPAMVLLLSLEESILLALEPPRIWRVLRHAGPAYLLFAGLIGAGSWGIYELLLLRADSFGPLSGRLASELSLATLLSIFGAMALLTSFAHFLGYIAYHRHEAMGLNEGFLNTAPRETREAHPLEEVERLAREHKHEEAAHYLEQLRQKQPLARQIAWVDELEKRRLWQELRHFSETLVCELLANRQEGPAAELTLRMLRHYSTFRTATAAEWLQLVRGAFRERPEQGFETLARLAEERFPSDPVLLDIALLRAQHETDLHQDRAAARRILEPFADMHDHPRITRLHALLDALR